MYLTILIPLFPSPGVSASACNEVECYAQPRLLLRDFHLAVPAALQILIRAFEFS